MTSQLWEAARRFYAAGFSVIPCKYKKPDLKAWQEYTVKRPTLREINQWFEDETIGQSMGLVLGQVSHNVVVIDLDGWNAVQKFSEQFPDLRDTYTVESGSRSGLHLYLRPEILPANLNVRVEGVGGFEIRGNGQYVIAPPSPHPSGGFYTVKHRVPIRRLANLNAVSEWMQSLREPTQKAQVPAGVVTQQKFNLPTEPRKKKFLQTVMKEELARVEFSHEGSRNMSLFYAGLRLANYAAAGELIWADCEARLLSAAQAVGTPEREARNTIASAWRIGSKNPKKVK